MKKSGIINAIIITATLVLFGTITALVIIISRGGLITKDGIVETGIIEIEVQPRNLNYIAFIDGSRIRVQDDRIRNVREGTYNLRIESTGYATWEKTITVSKGVVTSIDARLYPTTLDLKALTNTSINNAFFSKFGDYVYYVVSDSPLESNNGIWRLKLVKNQIFFGNNQELKLVDTLPSMVRAFEEKQYSVIPSVDNKRLIFLNEIDQTYKIYNAEDYNERATLDLNEALGFTPEDVSWLNDSDSLLVKHKSLLFEYDLASRQTTVVSYQPASKFVYANLNKAIFFADIGGTTIKKYENKITSSLNTEILGINGTIQNFWGAESNNTYRLIILTDQGYFYYDTSAGNAIFVADNTYSFIDIATNGNGAIFIKDGQVTSLTIKTNLTTNKPEAKLNLFNNLLYSVNDKIKYVPDSSHIIYYSDVRKRILLIEKDGINRTLLIKDAPTNSVFAVDANGENFFVMLMDTTSTPDTPKANIYAIDLTP